jgi:hypothetical protein
MSRIAIDHPRQRHVLRRRDPRHPCARRRRNQHDGRERQNTCGERHSTQSTSGPTRAHHPPPSQIMAKTPRQTSSRPRAFTLIYDRSSAVPSRRSQDPAHTDTATASTRLPSRSYVLPSAGASSHMMIFRQRANPQARCCVTSLSTFYVLKHHGIASWHRRWLSDRVLTKGRTTLACELSRVTWVPIRFSPTGLGVDSATLTDSHDPWPVGNIWGESSPRRVRTTTYSPASRGSGSNWIRVVTVWASSGRATLLVPLGGVQYRWRAALLWHASAQLPPGSNPAGIS